jgi:hypothetical protein
MYGKPLKLLRLEKNPHPLDPVVLSHPNVTMKVSPGLGKTYNAEISITPPPSPHCIDFLWPVAGPVSNVANPLAK